MLPPQGSSRPHNDRSGSGSESDSGSGSESFASDITPASSVFSVSDEGTAGQSHDCVATVKLTFALVKHGEILCTSLGVAGELRPRGTIINMHVDRESSSLVATFSSVTAARLRAALSQFMDQLQVCVSAIEELQIIEQ